MALWIVFNIFGIPLGLQVVLRKHAELGLGVHGQSFVNYAYIDVAWSVIETEG